MLELKLSLGDASIVILFFTLMAHGIMILLNDEVYFDGWYLVGWQRRKDFATMRTFYNQVGMPFLYYCHKFMAKLPRSIFWYKVLSFASLFLSSFFVYCLCQKSGSFTNAESLCIALLMLCYPGQHMTVEPTCIQYVFTLTLFLLGCLLGLQAEAAQGTAQWIMRGGAVVVFLISFNMNSLLAFYSGFILLLILCYISNEGLSLFGIIQYILKRGYYLALPFIYWFWKEKFTPRHGHYADYNRIRFKGIKDIVAAYMQLLRTGVGGVFMQSLLFLFKQPIGWVIAAVCGGTALCLSQHFLLFESMTRAKSGMIILYGAFLMSYGSISYILVGQPFGLRGWATKNNALLALPMALIIFGAGSMIQKPSVIAPFLGVLIIAHIIYLNYNYLCLLAVYAKNRSWLLNLGKISLAKDISIFGVCNRHQICASLDAHPETIYLVYMFEWLWGDVTRLGINELKPRKIAYTPEEVKAEIYKTTIDYALQGIDPYGKQAQLIVRQGEQGLSEVQTAVRYLIYRFFKRDKFEDFLSGITQLELIPLKVDTFLEKA
ncbi:hypothetical protein KKB84_02475 [bacterium]|nr:hypothetical protein [bacterium]